MLSSQFPSRAPSHARFEMLSLNSIIQRDPEVIAAEADLDLIMVSIATGSYYGLSDVAREIWSAIEHPKKISDLVDELAATYRIDSTSCREQTLSFLAALLEEGLVRVQDGPAD
jgi:Coenzyme PQQ synthesis protein D (PqqD)